MEKASSLIKVSNTVKKLFIFLIIIATLALCWNTIKGIITKPTPVRPPVSKYRYLAEKPLYDKFTPIALKSSQGLSLYSKEILSKGSFPEFPEYVYIYSIEVNKEDFSTFTYAKSIAAKLNFSNNDLTFPDNQYIWKNDNGTLIFDRKDLKVSYSKSVNYTNPKPNTINNVQSYISSLGLGLSNIINPKPVIYKSDKGEVNIFYGSIDYIAMSTDSLTQYLKNNQIPSKANIIDTLSLNGNLLVEIKEDEEKLMDSSILQFQYNPLKVNTNSESAGVIKIMNINQAFQDINAYKLLTTTNQQVPVQGNLFFFTIINKNSFFTEVDPQDLTTLTINADQTRLAYLVAQSSTISYLHPIYIFTGEGTFVNGESYIFYIYVDALPKN